MRPASWSVRSNTLLRSVAFRSTICISRSTAKKFRSWTAARRYDRTCSLISQYPIFEPAHHQGSWRLSSLVKNAVGLNCTAHRQPQRRNRFPDRPSSAASAFTNEPCLSRTPCRAPGFASDVEKPMEAGLALWCRPDQHRCHRRRQSDELRGLRYPQEFARPPRCSTPSVICRWPAHCSVRTVHTRWSPPECYGAAGAVLG